MMVNRIPLLVVCGPTASGKTAVGVRLARELSGEVVSADSMQIYKGLRISTAKPTKEEMGGIPHHMMDFLEPWEEYSVADYVRQAARCIEDIRSRGKLPIVVGGTGLYINSLVDNITFDHIPEDHQRRRELEDMAAAMGREHMHRMLRQTDPEAAEKIHPNNVIRVIRAIEMAELSGKSGSENRQESRKSPSPYDLCMIGLTCFDRAVLYERINRRVDIMAQEGLAEEVRQVMESCTPHTAFNAIGYKELMPYFRGERTFTEALEDIKQNTRHYAKRQLTWFRRDERISWVDTSENCQIDGIIKNCLNIVAKSKIMCYNEYVYKNEQR